MWNNIKKLHWDHFFCGKKGKSPRKGKVIPLSAMQLPSRQLQKTIFSYRLRLPSQRTTGKEDWKHKSCFKQSLVPRGTWNWIEKESGKGERTEKNLAKKVGKSCVFTEETTIVVYSRKWPKTIILNSYSFHLKPKYTRNSLKRRGEKRVPRDSFFFN